MKGLDDKDKQILQILRGDARIPNIKLAEKVGLSPSACLRRVQDMEQRNIISGYRVVVDRSFLNIGFIAYVAVGLSQHSKESLAAFEKAIGRSEEVVECHKVTGSVEYLLRIEAADLIAYKKFHNEILGAAPSVTSITSFIVMDTGKDDRS